MGDVLSKSASEASISSGELSCLDAKASKPNVGWIWLYREDVRRYRLQRPNASVVVLLLLEQGLWALLQYRIASALYRSTLQSNVKMILLSCAVASQKLIEIVTGICLPYRAKIGPGLYIGHYGNIVIHGDVVLGHSCNISQGVTIGISGRGKKRGVPIIGDRVYIAANAVVVGSIVIGDDCVVAANSLVTRDVPSHATVMGVPADIVNFRGSEDYVLI